jgi:indolepyruvate ferredoxin oxidoreductase
VDPSRGDKVVYSHINRPRFDIGRFKIEFDVRTYNWQLNIMKRMKFLRRLLPEWHRPEKEFRDWYSNLLNQFLFANETQYHIWLEILRVPEMVTGYRHIRHPKQDLAKRRVESLLASLRQPVRDHASITF